MARAARQFEKNLFTQRGGESRPEIVTCMDDSEQCTRVCERILARYEQGIPLKDQAVLFRASHHSDQLEVELSRRNIPFVKYGGLKFVEAAHVKDMIAVMRLMENPADSLSWYRVLQLLEGIGPASALKLIEALNAKGPGGVLALFLENPPPVPAPAREEFGKLRAAVADCTGRSGGAELPPAAQLERVRKFYEPIFRRAYDNAEVRLRDLEQLEQIAGGYKTRGQFITDLTLDPPNSTQDLAGPPLLDEDFLILSTIHSAKGCEWDSVHIIHAADGNIPSDLATGDDEEIEEERRLLYVAMTRAKNRLSLFFPLRYYHAGRGFTDRHTYSQLTRFIPDAVATLFDRVGGHTAPIPDPTPASKTKERGREAVDALLNDLWSE
jgi:DNA helicase-2/ATP-dependent DNA helicase PcrA